MPGLRVMPKQMKSSTNSSSRGIAPAPASRPRVFARAALLAIALCGLALGVPAVASATPSPWWHLISRTQPTVLPVGGEATLFVQGVNLGDARTSGPSTVTDHLPPGLTVVEEEGVPQVQFYAFSFQRGRLNLGPTGPFTFLHPCTVTTTTVSCTTPEFNPAILPPLKPYEYIEMRVKVKVGAGVGSVANQTEVSGGGAPAVSETKQVTVGSGSVPFGVEEFSLVPEEEGGRIDTRAGSHPFQLTTTFSLNQNSDPASPPGLARNLQFKLPPGLVGNATALPRCSDLDFRHVTEGGIVDLCPGSTAVGVALITIDEPENLELVTFPVPLFNLVPERGEPARFGFELLGSPVTLDTSVRTGEDYGVTASVNNITELANFLSSTVAFWGVPGAAEHDSSRGWGCLVGNSWAEESGQPCTPASQSKPAPFLTLPTSCGPFEPSVEGASWPTKENKSGLRFAPVKYALKDSFGRSLSIGACDQLSFNPSIEVTPDVQSASTPTGLTTTVHVPQEVNENSTGLASSNVKDISVKLPEGVTLNPAGAGGLEACSEAQIGFLPAISSSGNLHFSPRLPSPFCPAASKIGTAKITTPLLSEPLEGAVYLATQNANPFGSLVAMYIVAEDPAAGVLVNLPGEVSLDQQTGRVTATVDDNPPLPFENAELHFFGGSRAPLSTPTHCGTYTTEASFTPWSGNPPVAASSSFQITSGPDGGPCPGAALPFSPTLAGGTTNIQAGAFTPLTTTISRPDGDQNIQSVSLKMPPGFSGLISSLTPCAEAQANAGTCGPESLIGHTVVSVGLGGEPFTVRGGEVFLTGPYRGAPFGLSIVNPAKAGPFDLGKVIVRAKLEIDRQTAQVNVVTDPSGPFAIPRILDGIPLQIRHVNVTVDRPGFSINPTNCNPLSITGSVASDEGADAAVAIPFQVTNCAQLKFTPKFTVSTSGRTSKANGAALITKLSYPKLPQGSEANIAKVKVSLPRQLPSRLTTLQKACLDTVFRVNPANCPKESIVGHAKVSTPLLPVPLAGPAYFVSHGNEAFPSLTIVLQGDNVTVELVGATQIRKGVTTTTFRSTPDTPFSQFELILPQGKFSALTTNANLCKNRNKLIMPTELQGQNGAEIKTNTKISVTNCPRHRKHTPHKRHRRSGHRKK
jgi:hypothetical protein